MAAILLVSAGALAYRAVTRLTHAAVSPEPSIDRRAAALGLDGTPSTPQTLPTPQTPQTPPLDPTLAAQDIAEPTPATDSVPLSEAVALPANPPLVQVEAALPASPAASARADSVVPRRPPPTAAEIQAALSATPIVMYSASWCGVCRKAKQFLSANGLRYQEIDVDETPGAWDKIAQLTGHRGVPWIIVDGEQTPPGLRPSRIMLAVSHSMQRRLGVSNIEFSPR